MKTHILLGALSAIAVGTALPIRADAAETPAPASAGSAQVANNGQDMEARMLALEQKIERLLRLIEDAERTPDSPFFKLNRQIEEIDRRLDRIERDLDDVKNDVRRLR